MHNIKYLFSNNTIILVQIFGPICDLQMLLDLPIRLSSSTGFFIAIIVIMGILFYFILFLFSDRYLLTIIYNTLLSSVSTVPISFVCVVSSFCDFLFEFYFVRVNFYVLTQHDIYYWSPI